MRDRDIWHRLDLLDLQDAQIGEPAVKAKQRIVVGTQVLRLGLAGSSVVEHPADRDAINICRGDAKADDAASEDVHDQQHPMAAQQDASIRATSASCSFVISSISLAESE